MSLYARMVNRFSTTKAGSWVARTVASRIDPWIYRATRGRFTSTGVPTIPQLILTTTGRKSGVARDVQLGYAVEGGDFLVVGSNFGQAHHPAWALNLAANPLATVTVDGNRVAVRAERLSHDDKERVWPRLVSVVPQFTVYVTRTDRDIRVFRLKRVP
jgi:deazaflavin-dependent oxidoreductase (nitroreductase family)